MKPKENLHKQLYNSDLLLIILRAAKFVLIVYPWTVLGAHVFEASSNPFSPTAMACAVLLGGLITAWLRRRSRRLFTYAIAHSILAAYTYLLWIGHARGVAPALPSPTWITALNMRADGLATTTEVFWFVSWVLLWWRGTRLTSPLTARVSFASRFELELGMLLWALALILGLGVGVPTDGLLVYLFACLVIGLLVIARIQRHIAAPTIPGATIVVLLATVLISRILLAWLPAAAGAVKQAVDFAGAAAGNGISNFFRWFYFRGSSSSPTDEGDGALPGPEGSMPMEPSGGLGETFTTAVIWSMVGLVGLAVATVAAIALIALLRYLSRRTPGTTDVTTGRRAIFRTMRALIRLWRCRFRRVYSNLHRHCRTTAHSIQETLWPGDPRALYRGLLRWGRMVGQPRQPHETPHEYGLRLANVLPPGSAAADTVATLTDLYAEVRYSNGPHHGTTLHWRKLRSRYWRLYQPFLMLAVRWWYRHRVRARPDVSDGAVVNEPYHSNATAIRSR